MPVEFLSDEQAATFGRFAGEVSLENRERFFLLDDAALELVAKRRGDHNRLGFAVQLTTVRFLGTFLTDPLDVPWSVVDYLASQVGVDDPSVAKRYAERPPTQWEHAAARVRVWSGRCRGRRNWRISAPAPRTCRGCRRGDWRYWPGTAWRVKPRRLPGWRSRVRSRLWWPLRGIWRLHQPPPPRRRHTR